MKFLPRNKAFPYFFFAACVCLAFSYPNIKANMEGIGKLQAMTRKNTQQAWQLKASQQAAEQQAQIAEERYKKGCLIVVARRSPESFTSLTPGEPVYDRSRDVPLPPGTVVCDANGNTAKIILNEVDLPVAGELAFTGNQEIIEKVRRRVRARYNLPNQ